MRAIFLIVASAAVLTHARPDLTLGYNPNAPKDNYDGPLPDHDAFGVRPDANQPNELNDASGAHNPASIGLFGTPDNTEYQAQGYQSVGEVPSSNGVTNLSNGAAYSNNGVAAQNTFDAPTSTNGDFSSSVQPTQSLVSSTVPQSPAAIQPNTLQPIITKSFYFESAPEEPEEENQAPRYVHVGRPQKNYKVIFIKAPTYGLNAPVIPIVPPNEEKTIIYVLSKKPELKQDIELPPVPTTEAVKPDVFFIKYKSEKEAHDAQHGIQAVYEQNTDADGNAQFEDGHLQSIAHAAFPNVVSGTGTTGLSAPGASYGKTGQNVEENARFDGDAKIVQSVVGGASAAPSQLPGDIAHEQGGYTVLSGTNDREDDGVDGGPAEVAISHEASAPQPEYLPPGGRYRY